VSYSGSFYRREYHRVVMPWKDAPLLQQLAWEVGGLLGLEGKGGGEGGGEIEGGEAPFSYVLLQHYRTKRRIVIRSFIERSLSWGCRLEGRESWS